jgi:hypothetical protein
MVPVVDSTVDCNTVVVASVLIEIANEVGVLAVVTVVRLALLCVNNSDVTGVDTNVVVSTRVIGFSVITSVVCISVSLVGLNVVVEPKRKHIANY